MNLEKSLTQVIGDDELFRKTMQIDKNAGNDVVAESDDANHVIDKNNSDFNDAEANQGNVVTHAIKPMLPIEDNKADESHASQVATHAIESSIPTENGSLRNERSNNLTLKIGTLATEPSTSGTCCKVGCMKFKL
jgi:hypothetical protein